MTTFYASQFTHVTCEFISCTACNMCINDRFIWIQKAEAGNALPALVRSVIAPVSHRDSCWDTSLIEAKFRLVLVDDGPPRKYMG